MRLQSLAATIVLVALPCAAVAEDLQPGQYRSHISSDIPGDKPRDDTHCVTQKDIDSGLTQLGAEQEQGCKVQDFKRAPGRVTYRTVCGKGSEANTTHVTGTFTRDTFDMKLQMLMDQGKAYTLRIAGKRIGACTGK